MTNRVTQSFARAKEQKRRLLCPFLTAGYPSLAGTRELLKSVQEVDEQTGGGIGCVELGIPFSDPVADGPVIQASFNHALTGGTTVKGVMEMVREARGAGVRVPLVAMVSYSIICKMGVCEFAEEAEGAGMDAVILADVPLEEASGVVEAFHAKGMGTSLLVAPSTPAERRAKIAALCDAFVYYLSVSGITGERTSLPADIAPNVAALRKLTGAPICVGFGISNAEHVRQVTRYADGAIVGSALIRQIAKQLEAPLPELAGHVREYLLELASGLV